MLTHSRLRTRNFRACPVLFQSQVCVWQLQLHPLPLRLCLNSSWINCRELKNSLSQLSLGSWVDIESLGGIFWQDKSERTENYRGELRSENLPCLSASAAAGRIKERIFRL